MSQPFTRTGYDSAAAVPPGAIVQRVYFAVPAYGWIGETFDSYTDALDHATTEKVKAIEVSKEANGGRNYVGERITVDTRWEMRYPQGGGVDTIMARDTYPTVLAARESLATRRRLAVR